MIFIQSFFVPHIHSHGINSLINDCKNPLGKPFYNMDQAPPKIHTQKKKKKKKESSTLCSSPDYSLAQAFCGVVILLEQGIS